VLHASGKALARGRFTPSVHQHVLRLLSRFPVALAPMRVSPLEFWAWCQSLQLKPYDASYLKVAVDLKAPLVTMDRGLRRACQQLEHPVITDLP
jgi:predicted nucleic acid-binding protein